MKKKICRLSVLLMILLISSSWALIDQQEQKNRIIKARDAMFSSPGTKDTLINSLGEFLDVVVELTSSSQYTEEITHHVEVAKDLIKKTSLFNDKARQYLSLAYRMITNGQKYQRPEELDEFVTPAEAQQKAISYAKKLIEKSLVELESGNTENAAKYLLEVVILVVTPVSG